MSGICIITLTILNHIIPGSVASQVGLSAESSSEPGTQYGDHHHHFRRLPPSHPSYNEAPPYPRYMFNALRRDVESTQYPRSSEDSRMLKQIWDAAVNSQEYSQKVAENRKFLYPSFGAWKDSFTSFFWRDMAFNVFKIVGLSALYYLAPGVLDWYTVTFGNT